VTPCSVYTVYKEMRSADFLIEPQNQGRRFPGLSLQTDSNGLVIWVSKSARQFLDLDLKTKQGSVYRLRQETNGRRIRWDTYQDLAACFDVK
jgi:hypothetical protein